MDDIRMTLKKAIVEELRLEDVTPEEIDDAAPLFGEGLGLDSLDAVELTVLVQRLFDVALDDADTARETFASINALASHIEKHANRNSEPR
jgi:acyl carrier protein